MQDERTDAALVGAARDGDREALARLLARHRPLLHALCRRAFGDPALAEDAAQEAALQAMLNLDRLRRPERFGAWLAGIGLNVCRHWLRLRQPGTWSWEALQGGRQVTEPVDWRAGPAELAEAADLAARGRHAVAGLPRGQRAAALLFYFGGLTYAETAAALGVEVGTVKTRLHKARRTLHRQLQMVWQEETMAAMDPQSVEMRVADVRRALARGDTPPRHLVMLAEVGGARQFPLWVGAFEAEAMALTLRGLQAPRPLAYTLTLDLLRAAGGRLREVRIARVADGIIYATVAVESAAGDHSIDARPSDALNLALIAGAPVRVEPGVLAAEEANRVRDPERVPKTQEVYYGAGSAGAAEIAAEIAASRPG